MGMSNSGMPAMLPVDRSIHSCVLGALSVCALAARPSRHRLAASTVGRTKVRKGVMGRSSRGKSTCMGQPRHTGVAAACAARRVDLSGQVACCPV